MTRRSRWSLLVLQGCCLLAGMALLSRPVYRWAAWEWSQHRASKRWADTRVNPHASFTPGAPAFWLRIPQQGFSDLVLYQDTEENLDRHACVAQESPLVILGHRDTHFRKLIHVGMADLLELETPYGRIRRFQVSEIEVLPAEQAPGRIEDHRNPESLVLMTCYPFQYIGAAPDRYLVWANPIPCQSNASESRARSPRML